MDYKELVKKRGSLKAKVTLFKSFLEPLQKVETITNLQTNEINFRLSKMEDLYSDYDNIQSDIETLSEIPDLQYKERQNFESEYFGALAAAREVLTRFESADDRASSNGGGEGSVAGSTVCCANKGRPAIKLPTIHLPTFSGQYQDWLEFHDTYTSLIHSDNSIPKINKFHYLRAALKDSAAIVIQSLDFSAENYDIAWSLLCDRYHNNRLLINNHIQSIFNIEALTKESSKALRHIIDTINKNLRALKTLKLPTEHWDILVIYIICKKLDYNTSREWETHRNVLKELPTLAEFIDFLKNRSTLLETVDESQIKRRYSDVTPNRPKTFIANTLTTPTNTYICPLCKNKHAIYQCYRFKSLPVKARIQKATELKLCLNCLRKGHSEQKCRLGPCRLCSGQHNTLLHINQESSVSRTIDLPSTSMSTNSVVLPATHHPVQSSNEVQQSSNNIVLSSLSNDCVLLSTALIQVTDCEGNKHKIRALLDNGSTSSFVTQTLSDKLNLRKISTSTAVEGINGQSSFITQNCDVTISSLTNTFTTETNCLIVPQITQFIPSKVINCSDLNIPNCITLADPTFHTPSQIDMLLGADIFWTVLCPNKITLGKHKPTLCETKLGWLLSGAYQSNKNTHNNHKNTVHCNHASVIQTHNDYDLHNQVERLIDLEAIKSHTPMSKEEQECEQIFSATTEREADGRFLVTIPLKQSPENLGSSYQRALSRFLSLEARFKRDPTFKQQYSEFIMEYISLGHMTLNVNPENDIHQYILPHHGVLRETSLTTKLRVVFDASAVTTSGLSFNDIQKVGPTVQDDLVSILIRFRQHKIVVTADVEKMYRMININKTQRVYQQILWRFSPVEELKQYYLNTVTYGTASAPYLATRCLQQLGKDCPDKSVSDVIVHDFYVDDLITGHDSEENLIAICKGVKTQLESGQLHLRKWHSNNKHIIQTIIDENNPEDFLDLSKNEYSKTLGLLWSCKGDYLSYSINLTQSEHISKRIVLSIFSQIFDPLGLIGPCTLPAKLLIQKLWSLKLSWDETIPTELQTIWHNFLNTLTSINNIKIPRHIIIDAYVTIEMHAFSDASAHAYAACVYLRSISKDNQVTVRLVTAKCRVAPLKNLTIPRLELCGALLAANLAHKVKSSLRLTIHKTTFWSDSTIVLGWIKSSKLTKLKSFVSNRINSITEITDKEHWQYVPTSFNPADIGSRGMEVSKLQNSSLWWTGPDYLLNPDTHWPSQPNYKSSDLSEVKIQCHLSSNFKTNEYVLRFSEFSKLQRITAYIFRFKHNCQHKHNKMTGYLQIHELISSHNALCRLAQQESFPLEYSLLKNKKPLPPKNKHLSLNPFLHEDGLIRVGGRISNSHYDYDTKHPIMIHAKHHISKLIFRQYHKILLHPGPQLLLAISRHKYWVLAGRNLARQTVNSCVTCCRYSGKTLQPIMGNLPEQRLHADYPFSNTAVDYAGPIMILNRKGRGSRLIKAYLCIFVCLTVRAIHIELVTDLSKDTFLSALHRFISRRGKPVNIFSDNGTSFVGACNELKRFLKVNSSYIGSYASELQINFKFSPAYSPHFNGMAESSVKSVKHHLKRVVSQTNLTYEEMNTVLIEIEGILNSRPITPISSDPRDLSALTPSHFLIGRTITVLPSPQVQDVVRMTTMSRYLRIQQLKAHFWRRFYTEYISELQRRQKWRKDGVDLHLDDMVLIKDERLPPNRWLLGRVSRLYPGTDGISRVADVTTTSGTVRRAYNRLCPLPVLDQQDTSLLAREHVNA